MAQASKALESVCGYEPKYEDTCSEEAPPVLPGKPEVPVVVASDVNTTLRTNTKSDDWKWKLTHSSPIWSLSEYHFVQVRPAASEQAGCNPTM